MFNALKVQQQIAYGLVSLLRLWNAKAMVVGHFLRCLKFSGENQITNLWEIANRISIVVVVWVTRPETGFIQRDTFLVDPSKDHCPHVAVAQRHRLEPLLCGLTI